MAKRKIIDRYGVLLLLSVAGIMLWERYSRVTFNYFWIAFWGLGFVFLIYYGATWRNDIKRMADAHKMSAKNMERE